MTDTAVASAPTRSRVRVNRIGFFWPLGAWVFLAAGVAIFAVTLLRTGAELSWSYQEWAHTNGLFQGAGLDITGPLTAAFGALLSGRLTPPSRVFALPRFARDKTQFLAHNLAPAALVVTMAYLFGLTPVLVHTVRTATAGSLSPIDLVSGILVLNTLLAVGWLIGLYSQSAFAAPIAFAAGFAAVLCGYGIGAWNAVTPVVASVGVVGQSETTQFRAFRAAFYAMVLIVVLITAGSVLSSRGFDRRLPPMRYALLWLLPAALFAAGLIKPPTAVVHEANSPRICRVVDGLPMCLHGAHVKEFAPLIAEVSPVIALVGRENLPFDRIEDWSLSDGSTPPKDRTIFYADASPRWGVAGAGSTIASLVAGSEVCAKVAPDSTTSGPGFNAFMLSERLTGLREKRPDSRFGGLSDAQVRQWLTEHRRQVMQCAITDAMLP